MISPSYNRVGKLSSGGYYWVESRGWKQVDVETHGVASNFIDSKKDIEVVG
jgi:hypothetical protein